MDNKFNSWHLPPLVQRYGFPIFTVVLFVGLFGIAIFNLMREARVFADEMIAQDMQRLAAVFKRIDETCVITEFDHQTSYIDFLNVEKFVGSEVGAMHLMFPDKWQGPYMENPKVYGKPYAIVRTKTGYFIVPPIGTHLSNGYVVGADLKVDESADIEQMIKSPKGFSYNDKPLAVKISISGISGALMQLNAIPAEEDA